MPSDRVRMSPDRHEMTILSSPQQEGLGDEDGGGAALHASYDGSVDAGRYLDAAGQLRADESFTYNG